MKENQRAGNNTGEREERHTHTHTRTQSLILGHPCFQRFPRLFRRRTHSLDDNEFSLFTLTPDADAEVAAAVAASVAAGFAVNVQTNQMENIRLSVAFSLVFPFLRRKTFF